MSLIKRTQHVTGKFIVRTTKSERITCVENVARTMDVKYIN
jgi:hypothetical protein